MLNEMIIKTVLCDHINPRLTKLFFVTRLTRGGCYNPLNFPNRTLYEIDFGINR